MKKHLSTSMERSLMIGLVLGIALLTNACATFKKPAAIDEAPIQDRAQPQESNGIRASAAVVGDGEARRIFGIDLARKKIQAVWLAVENNTDRSLIFLPTAIDPDYFSPLEVSFAFQRAFAAEANKSLKQHLMELNFPVRSLIEPGSRTTGYIFTNWKKGMKVIDIDLVGSGFSQNFTFFAPNPESSLGLDIINRMESMYSESELEAIENETDLRRTLEQLPCCVTRETGGPPAEPLNVVVIGDIYDWTTAFGRRGYAVQDLDARYAFGRSQDASGKRLNRGYIQAQTHTVRLWQTPLRYHGKPVWVAQTSARLGGRFAGQAPSSSTLPVDPRVDQARDDLTQDLAYSQALIKIGYVKGSGNRQPVKTGEISQPDGYTTDGLRAVLVFGDRPASLAAIDFLDWERLADYR